MLTRLFAFHFLLVGCTIASANEKELLEARYNVARNGFVTAKNDFKQKKASVEDVVNWSKRVLYSGLEAEAAGATILYEMHLKRMKELESEVEARKGDVSDLEKTAASFARADAEVELAKAKAKDKKRN